MEDTDPTLLMAYMYHLYMGLFSGGIILRKKRQLMQKISPFKGSNSGNNITDFGESSIYELKRDLRESMNRIAESLDEDMKNKLIEESKIVFKLNNEIIKSVQTGGNVLESIYHFIVQLIRIALILLVLLTSSYIIIQYLFIYLIKLLSF